MFRTNGYLAVALFFPFIFINSPLCLGDDKTEIVNQQLDQVSREFPNLPLNTEKVFLNGNQDQNANAASQVSGQSAGGMFKELLSPDLSGDQKPKPVTNVITRAQSLDAGAEVFYYRYDEPGVLLASSNANVRIKDVGPMYGYYANYVYRPADPNFFNNFLTSAYFLQARFATSHDLQYSGEGNIKNKHADAMELRGLIGKDYFIGTEMRVTPYFGFGYRYFFNRGNGQITSLNIISEDEKSHYYYLPFGANVAVNLPKDWEVDLNTEYDILLQGYQKSYFSNWDQFTGDSYPNLSFHQEHGFGMRGSIKFLKKGPMVDFYVEPYIRFWNIGQSKADSFLFNGTTYQVVWPKNYTTELGSRFGIQF